MWKDEERREVGESAGPQDSGFRKSRGRFGFGGFAPEGLSGGAVPQERPRFDVPSFSAMIGLVPNERDRLEEIRNAFRTGHYEISRHATARMLRRGIRTDEIEETMGAAEIIEEYPNDKYGPSLLLLGFTRNGRPLHVQVAWSRMRIVTVYEPDPQEWSDWRTRRTPHE